EARWASWILDGFESRDIGIAAATNWLAAARVVRSTVNPRGVHPTSKRAAIQHTGGVLFLFILNGELTLDSLEIVHQLGEGDSLVIPAAIKYTVRVSAGLEMLEVRLPAEGEGAVL